jgi:hypothetical protein
VVLRPVLDGAAAMIHLRYLVEFPNDDRPTRLPRETRAVLARFYEHIDIGQGGITTEEVNPNDVQSLGLFAIGCELFVESALASDCLDDTDDDTSKRTRIWWRIELVDRETT